MTKFSRFPLDLLEYGRHIMPPCFLKSPVGLSLAHLF